MVYQVIDIGGAFIGFGVAIAIILICAVMVPIMRPQTSWFYRKYLVNLYVAGRIRQLAEKDKVDLVEEEKNFLTYESVNTKQRIRDLDNKIEVDLMKRVEETNKKESSKTPE